MLRRFWPLVLLVLVPACDGQDDAPEYRKGGEQAVLEETVQPADRPTPQTQPATQPATRPAPVLRWSRPRFKERQDQRRHMVATQMASSWAPDVNDPRVLEAMRQVPRHRFVPIDVEDVAYADTALPIGYGQTISQPYIVGLMTQLLKVQPGDKVLEIGTGSGYQAAVLSELTPHVFTIEIVDPLGKAVAERFKQLKYETVRARIGDGYDGWKEHAPFDAIIVTCAATHVPPPLFEQLKPDGVMCIPVGIRGGDQNLILVTKAADGSMRTRTVLGVRFVPLTGGHD